MQPDNWTQVLWNTLHSSRQMNSSEVQTICECIFFFIIIIVKVWMNLIQDLKMIIFLGDQSFVFPHKLSKLIGKCKLGCLEFAFQNIRHSFYTAIKAAILWKPVTINIFLTFSGSYCQATLEKSMMKFWTGKLICINGFRVSTTFSHTLPPSRWLEFSPVKSYIKRRRQIAYLTSLF